MALNATTLSAAVALTDTTLLLASVTGITGPNFQTGFDPVKGVGAGPVYLYIEQEWMQVLSTPASATVPVQVKRAMLGSCASVHAASAVVLSGQATDFPGPIPISIKASQDYYPNLVGFSAPVASATTITASGYLFHVTGATPIATINPPSAGPSGSALPLDGSEIIIVFDSVETWTAAGNIAAAGSSTTAGSAVRFIFDQGSGKWHPQRVA